MTAPVQAGPSTGGPTSVPDWDEELADIGDRVRAERQARGWSQTVLAQRSRATLTTVKRLEAGQFTRYTLNLACRAMRVDPDHLVYGDWRLPERPVSLSPRQVDVMREVAAGGTLAEVGARLGMAAEVVGSHLSRIYRRLGVENVPAGERRAAAVRAAVRLGLIRRPRNRTS